MWIYFSWVKNTLNCLRGTHVLFIVSEFSINDQVRLFDQALDWYKDGKLGIIHPTNIYHAADALGALKRMQKGTHIGKFLLKLPEDWSRLPGPSMPSDIIFPTNATYILIGGLGGLGKVVSSWMVEHGARELVYLSRSAGQSKDDQRFFNELSVQGCNVVCVSGSVVCLADVKRAVSACTHPLRGILQMAAVLRVNLVL